MVDNDQTDLAERILESVADGEALGSVAVARDVTERVERERAARAQSNPSAA